MKIPEPLFVIVNMVVKLILRSPLHFVVSNSLLVITFTGRKSGKTYSTPVRYIRVDGRIRCFTSDHGQWWRNVKKNPDIVLLVKGEKSRYQAFIRDRDHALTQESLVHFLNIFPQDAVYQDIRLNKDGSLNVADLDKASYNAIVVEFTAEAG